MKTNKIEPQRCETHTACDTRVAEKGGKATCCYCDPHEPCDFFRHQQPEKEDGFFAILKKTINPPKSKEQPEKEECRYWQSPKICPIHNMIHHPEPKEEQCGMPIIAGHSWCAEKYPCKLHGIWKTEESRPEPSGDWEERLKKHCDLEFEVLKINGEGYRGERIIDFILSERTASYKQGREDEANSWMYQKANEHDTRIRADERTALNRALADFQTQIANTPIEKRTWSNVYQMFYEFRSFITKHGNK